MNNRNRQRLKALDMRIRSKSNGLWNLKLACEFGKWIMDSYRKNLILKPYLPFTIQNRNC